jgi:hypothetical protein
MSFRVDVEPTTWHAWVVLSTREILDWNGGMPTELQASVHDLMGHSPLKRPFEPVYEELFELDVLEELFDKQQRVVAQWLGYAMTHFPGVSFTNAWTQTQNQCLINSYVTCAQNKARGARVAFGRFGWRRADDSVYFEFDGKAPEEQVREFAARNPIN